MTITNGLTSKLFVGFVVMATIFSLSFAPAKAATIEELEAQINALLAQIAGLTGGSTTGGSTSCNFTMDLTMGSSGAEVTALQNWLISKGYTIPAGATGYFGAQTQAAVKAFQMANAITPAAGYFGPITRAKVNSMCTVAGDDDADDDANDDDDDGALEGGAGSVDSYELMSSLNNEEVGEDEEDVEVAGLEIETDDGSDLSFTSVRVMLEQGDGGTTGDLDDYADSVSIMLDGEEVGRVDADDFTEDGDDDADGFDEWTKTISLDDAIIRAGETGELTVAVSGASNIDSDDATDDWDIDFEQVRFRDADGSTISEDPGTGPRTFTFETFASAADTELKISADDDDINDERIIDVDNSDDTDNVEVFSFSIEIEGDSDVTVDDLPINIDSVEATGNDPDDIVTSVTLLMDGDEVGSESLLTSDADDSDETVTFDDLDLTLEAGQEYHFVVEADFVSTGDTMDEGDTVAFQIGSTERGNIDAEDESGTDLASGDRTGTASAGPHEVHDVFIELSFVSANADPANNDTAPDDDVGTFTMVFDITARGGSVYVGDTAAGTTVADGSVGIPVTDAIVYRVYDSGAATTDDLADTVTFTTPSGVTDSTDNILITEDHTSRVTLTVTQTNNTAEDDGIYFMDIAGVGWGIADDTTYEFVNDFNLDEFETTTISLN